MRYTLIHEPRDDIYTMLLRVGSTICTDVLLVVRPELEIGASGQALLARMKVYLREEKQSAQWPGTLLYGRTATVSRFAFTSEVLFELVTNARGLFDWQQPALPEDPCLLRENGIPWLTTIAHEHDAYIDLTQDELFLLRKEYPLIAQSLKKE
jgi:hypothetical protein